ncbi:hypothetical protein [Aeromicrobium fastidiosum]|uniref:hypothetical protein n=1 Tax=Aeromicrobium fastidiosum TaxID=52699 RepID=UPI0027E1DCFD|nr:hypothetical protein [Aeromicrobium fastidiosum]
MVDRDGVRRRAECCGDRGLEAAADRQQRGDGTEQAADLVGRGEQRAGAVLARQPQLERLLAGRQTGLLTLGRVELVGDRRQARGRLLELGLGGLELLVEPRLARVEARDLVLEGRELLLRLDGPRLGLVARRRQAPDLLAGRRGAAAQGVDLAVQTGQPLALVGCGAQQPGDPSLLGGCLLYTSDAADEARRV